MGKTFWTWFLITLAITGAFFAWELKLIDLPLPMLPRPPATTFELTYTALLTILLSVDAGLFGWRRKSGSCPIGTKRTVGFAGTMGALALLCPVCLALPAALIGFGTFFAIVAAFLPLIRFIAILFAVIALWMLLPRKK